MGRPGRNSADNKERDRGRGQDLRRARGSRPGSLPALVRGQPSRLDHRAPPRGRDLLPGQRRRRRRAGEATGAGAGIPGLRPHLCRHTFATRLRQSGADPAQVQALLRHASIYTAARYFRAGSAENAAVIDRVFGD